MRKFLTVKSMALLLLGILSQPLAGNFQIGQSVILEAKKPVGVPLHREPSPSYLKHVPSGTAATIQDIAQDGHWFSIRLSSGTAHWVHQKYIRANTTPSAPEVSVNTPHSAIPDTGVVQVGGESDIWSNRERCQEALARGFRMADTASPPLRVATWNVRWFPTGSPPEQPESSHEPTDMAWLICAIRWMQVDVLAMQESLATPEATQAWKMLTDELSHQTGEHWRWHQQTCGRPEDHHIALLWNDSRVTLSKFDSLWQFNAKAESRDDACTFGLRPGHYAYVQSRKNSGVDFHLIAVHLKSGPNVFALEERQKAFNRIDKAVSPLLPQDRDVVIIGDFNTMGAGDRQSQLAELKYLKRFVAKENPGFRDLAPEPQCSHYFRGRGGQLDHVVVTKEMKEISTASIQVSGYCAITQCQRIRGDYPLAYRRLSDHCPVVLDITNQDND